MCFVGESILPALRFIGCVFVDEDVAEVGEESESVVSDGEIATVVAHDPVNFGQSVASI